MKTYYINSYDTRFTTEDDHDTVLVESFINYIRVSELLKKRISDTQCKMHKATTELAEMKKSWVYRILKFITTLYRRVL